MINYKEGISVIITVYNNSQYLKRSLRSVINQTKQPQEIIVVDDGSSLTHSKNTKKIIKTFNFKYTIKYVYKNNEGPSSSRNYGLKLSLYKYICFLDVDDEMTINNIKNKYNYLIKQDDSKVFGVYSNARFFNSRSLIFSNESNINIDSIGRVNGMCGSSPCYLFYKKHLLDVKGFDEKLINNEDFDLIIRLLKINYKFKYINDFGLIIHQTKNSVSRNKNFRKKFNYSLNFLKKAQKNDYFSDKELNNRFKETYITFSKDLFLEKYFTKEFFYYLDKSFLFSKPANLKEYFLFFISKLVY